MAKNRKIKILINTPNYKKPYLGGVANHYYGLRPYWNENVKYNIIGSRNGNNGNGKYLIFLDIIKFIWRIFYFKPDCIILNPSLAATALKRDLIYYKICTILKKKVIIFFHGFNPKNVERINGNTFYLNFRRSDAFIVLSKFAKSHLEKWGIKATIYLSSTKVDNRMLDNFDINSRQGSIKNILFLTRIEKTKGIFEALSIFKMLSNLYPSLKYTIVGSGSALKEAIRYSDENNIPNIYFTGMLTGNDLINTYKSADLYVFTSHYEGMPTTVLEAMAFGLPVITSNVGGLKDFFINGKMGEMIDSLSPSDYVKSISKYISDCQLSKETSIYNHNYATQHFLASNVAKSIENICYNVIK